MTHAGFLGRGCMYCSTFSVHMIVWLCGSLVAPCERKNGRFVYNKRKSTYSIWSRCKIYRGWGLNSHLEYIGKYWHTPGTHWCAITSNIDMSMPPALTPQTGILPIILRCCVAMTRHGMRKKKKKRKMDRYTKEKSNQIQEDQISQEIEQEKRR